MKISRLNAIGDGRAVETALPSVTLRVGPVARSSQTFTVFTPIRYFVRQGTAT